MHSKYPETETEKLHCALSLLLSAFDRQLTDGRRVNQTLTTEALDAFRGPVLGARIALQNYDLLRALRQIESALSHEPEMYSDILLIARNAITKAS